MPHATMLVTEECRLLRQEALGTVAFGAAAPARRMGGQVLACFHRPASRVEARA